MKQRISFCIPCYRSAKTIGPVIDEIIAEVSKRAEEFDYEIVCVIDGSPDNVFSVLQGIAAENSHVKVINLAKNFGQAGARMATLRFATGDFLVCLDDDGQSPMNHLWDLFRPMEEEGMDICIAKYPHKTQSRFKNFGSQVNRMTTQLLLDVPKDFAMTNFYVMRRFIARELIRYQNPYPFMTGLIIRTTKNFRLVPMEDRKRMEGTTGYTFKKLLAHWLNGLTAFSVIPLRISSFAGVICAVMGFLFGLVTVVRKLLGANIAAGYSSTIAILLFIGGLIMMMLGMIGEYVGRIYICLNNAPQYVVRETINLEIEEQTL